MSVSQGTYQWYNNFITEMWAGSDFGAIQSDDLIMLLTTSSYTFSAAHSVLADITNEVSGSGYARQTLANVSIDDTNGVITLSCDDIEFGPASGGSITARRWVLFDDDTTGDKLIASGLLDDTPADVVATEGNKIIIQPPSGEFMIFRKLAGQ
jgi:hypothetical protein